MVRLPRQQSLGRPVDEHGLAARVGAMSHATHTPAAAQSPSAGRLVVEIGYQDIENQSEEARAVRWTPEATGHRSWTFDVDVTGISAVGIHEVADAAFVADNSPFRPNPLTLAGRIRDAMDRAYEATADRHHSLSIGDRVRVGEAEVVCTHGGWVPVAG